MTNNIRTNISISPELLAKAKEYNINISQAARDGIVAAICREMAIEELLRSGEGIMDEDTSSRLLLSKIYWALKGVDGR